MGSVREILFFTDGFLLIFAGSLPSAQYNVLSNARFLWKLLSFRVIRANESTARNEEIVPLVFALCNLVMHEDDDIPVCAAS